MADNDLMRFPVPKFGNDPQFSQLVDFFSFLNINEIGKIGDPKLVAQMSIYTIQQPFCIFSSCN